MARAYIIFTGLPVEVLQLTKHFRLGRWQVTDDKLQQCRTGCPKPVCRRRVEHIYRHQGLPGKQMFPRH